MSQVLTDLIFSPQIKKKLKIEYDPIENVCMKFVCIQNLKTVKNRRKNRNYIP